MSERFCNTPVKTKIIFLQGANAELACMALKDPPFPTHSRAKWEEPLAFDLGDDLILYTPRAPSSGPVLGLILNILKYFDYEPNGVEDPVLFQRIAEAFKWAFGDRTQMGDPDDPEITDIMNEVSNSKASISFKVQYYAFHLQSSLPT